MNFKSHKVVQRQYSGEIQNTYINVANLFKTGQSCIKYSTNKYQYQYQYQYQWSKY